MLYKVLYIVNYYIKNNRAAINTFATYLVIVVL